MNVWNNILDALYQRRGTQNIDRERKKGQTGAEEASKKNVLTQVKAK